VAQEHIEEFDFDIIAMLNEAGMDTDDLVEMLYFMLTAYDGTIMWMGLEAGPDWLYHYIDTMLTTMQWSADEDMAMFRMLATVGRMYAILGDYADVFFEMPIFEDLFLVFDDRLGDAIILDPGFEETLAIYGTELLDILDFRLHDALSEHFADTQADMPRGLAVLDALLGGLLTQNMDELYHFYIYGEPMPVFALDRFWRFLSEWEYITLTYENLEERMSFDVDTGTEFAIDLFHGDDNSRLNLFFDNHADVYATFVIEFPGVLAWREYVLDVAPGGSATMQITADERGLPGGMVWVMIVNTEGGEVGGEFALRKTHHPLY
ncbi:MAG: hypothetical protein LBE55_00420, partial [Clostridiales bacterium]|nr:hypothetical protein [Clostridiales bacterium]